MSLTNNPQTDRPLLITDETGRPGQRHLKIATPLYKPGKRTKNGSDANAIGAWPVNGISGTQLEPNRNSKPS